jgi:integrase
VLYEGLRQQLGEVIRRLAEQKVKLKKGQRFGFHNFRHGLASWLVNQGTEIKMVQGHLGHANVSTTLGLYAYRVNSSMLAAQDSMMRALHPNRRPFNRV